MAAAAAAEEETVEDRAAEDMEAALAAEAMEAALAAEVTEEDPVVADMAEAEAKVVTHDRGAAHQALPALLDRLALQPVETAPRTSTTNGR